jgi:predicted DNA-binding protein YlxM (UPF0122 family)
MLRGKKCMFTKKQAEEIKRVYKVERLPYRMIAERFNCSISAVFRVVNNCNVGLRSDKNNT